MHARWLWWLLLPAAIAAVTVLGRPHPAVWQVQPDGQPCEAEPLRLEQAQPPNTAHNGDVLLAVNGAYVGVICAPGILTYQARGDFGQGRGPQLLVSSADRTLFSGELTKENRAYTFPVQPGPIALSFDDDYAGSAGDRNVWLSGVTVATR